MSLEFEQPEGHPVNDDAIPVSWVRRESLALCRPDLEEQIMALDDAQYNVIAQAVSDGLEQVYWSAVNEALTEHFGIPLPDDNETDETNFPL